MPKKANTFPKVTIILRARSPNGPRIYPRIKSVKTIR